MKRGCFGVFCVLIKMPLSYFSPAQPFVTPDSFPLPPSSPTKSQSLKQTQQFIPRSSSNSSCQLKHHQDEQCNVSSPSFFQIQPHHRHRHFSLAFSQPRDQLYNSTAAIFTSAAVNATSTSFSMDSFLITLLLTIQCAPCRHKYRRDRSRALRHH